MSTKVRYEYALVDIAENFEYDVVRTRSYARELKRDWNKGYPEAKVKIVQRKYSLQEQKVIR